ncbi:MAG TPA: hypothetical protein VLT91_07625 [Rhizomicrobium sp.]|nr:hypothetical protein [Rhizomicrobium sp.]
MRALVLAFPVLLAAGVLGHAATGPAKNAPVNPEVDICVKAAAAADHIKADDVDKDACVCATKELHLLLKPDDFDLHEKMLTVIAGGADKNSFDKQMSDIMLKRGMKQPDVDAFLARSKKAENAAQTKCNSSPLLNPQPLSPIKP